MTVSLRKMSYQEHDRRRVSSTHRPFFLRSGFPEPCRIFHTKPHESPEMLKTTTIFSLSLIALETFHLFIFIQSRWSMAKGFSEVVGFDDRLIIESHTARGGVIFSDGMESDFCNSVPATLPRSPLSRKRQSLFKKVLINDTRSDHQKH